MEEDHLKINREGSEVETDRDKQQARTLIAKAGDAAAPPGMTCVGFGVVFFYRPENRFSSQELETHAHCYLRHVSERFAGVGYQTLRNHMMAHFGRRAPKITVEDPG